MPPRIAKLVALGAFGAVALFVFIFVVIAIAATPRRTGGIDITQAVVTWISVGIAVLGLIGLHIVLARGLLDYSRGRRRTV